MPADALEKLVAAGKRFGVPTESITKQ